MLCMYTYIPSNHSLAVKLMMACFPLLLITILSVASGRATPLYCSDVQSPASGSHSTDLSQVTTLQYCIIDNCTIMRIDTGQQLDIVYTTESLLIVTPIDGHNSMMIAKIDDQPSCFAKGDDMADGNWIGRFIGAFSLALLIIMASGYILIVHLLFKELRTLFGILLIFHSFLVVSQSIAVIALLVTHDLITVNSQMICHTIMVVYVIGNVGFEVFATDMMTHLAYVMYRCRKLKSEINTKQSHVLFKWYAIYAFGTLLLFACLTISYDLITGSGKYLLLPNGRCGFFPSAYKTLYIRMFFVIINKAIQLTMFIAYLVHFYKFIGSIGKVETSSQYSLELFRIAIGMGATIGLSYFIWILPIDQKYSNITSISGAVLLFIQQCVIMTSYLCTKKMSELWKKCFSRN